MKSSIPLLQKARISVRFSGKGETDIPSTGRFSIGRTTEGMPSSRSMACCLSDWQTWSAFTAFTIATL